MTQQQKKVMQIFHKNTYSSSHSQFRWIENFSSCCASVAYILIFLDTLFYALTERKLLDGEISFYIFEKLLPYSATQRNSNWGRQELAMKKN